MTSHALTIRRTHRFAPGWAHLDEFFDVGTVTEIAMGESQPHDDHEGFTRTLFVCVDVTVMPHPPRTGIEQALLDTYSGTSCRHDYDGCGCLSRSAVATHMKADIWRVDVTGRRIY